MATSYFVYSDDRVSSNIESLEPSFSVFLVVVLKVLPSSPFSWFSLPFLCCYSQFGLPIAIQICYRNHIFSFANSSAISLRTILMCAGIHTNLISFLCFFSASSLSFILRINIECFLVNDLLLRHMSTLLALEHTHNDSPWDSLIIYKVFQTTIDSSANIDANFVFWYWCLISQDAVTHKKPTNSW
jgi:hypothetical protein